MATWHQKRAEMRYVFKTWTIVSDPPNDLRTHTGFPNESTARTTLALWKARGERFLYLYPPTEGAR